MTTGRLMTPALVFLSIQVYSPGEHHKPLEIMHDDDADMVMQSSGRVQVVKMPASLLFRNPSKPLR